MTLHHRDETARDEPRIINGRPEGQLDWELDCLIREKIALDGFEAAQFFVAMCLNRFNDRLAGRPRQ